MSTTLDVIGPIIYVTYGRSLTTEALAQLLARSLDADPNGGNRGRRERLVMNVCWDWMPEGGGEKAEMVAEQIEAALS